MFIVGTIHPPPGKAFTEAMPSGYGLSQAALETMKLVGLPITVEHNGIFEATAELQVDGVEPTGAAIEKYLRKQPGIETSPVGVIIDCR